MNGLPSIPLDSLGSDHASQLLGYLTIPKAKWQVRYRSILLTENTIGILVRYEDLMLSFLNLRFVATRKCINTSRKKISNASISRLIGLSFGMFFGPGLYDSGNDVVDLCVKCFDPNPNL